MWNAINAGWSGAGTGRGASQFTNSTQDTKVIKFPILTCCTSDCQFRTRSDVDEAEQELNKDKVFKITKNGIDDPIGKAEIERTNEWAPKEEGELDELGDWD